MDVIGILSQIIPPFVRRAYGRALGKSIRFTGPYSSWDQAKMNSTGYDSQAIVDKVKATTLLVLSGQAAYERDSVPFKTPNPPFAVINCFLRVAIKESELSVMDFGGSLGSVYYQCRQCLDEVKSLRWSVIEQERFVSCGRQFFESDQLRFYKTIRECLRDGTPNTVLLSSVLQYLPVPHDVISEIKASGIKYIVMDRTGVTGLDEDTLAIQHVPSHIYAASYPIWLLSERRLLDAFADKYELLTEFDSFETWRLGSLVAANRGYFFRRITDRPHH